MGLASKLAKKAKESMKIKKSSFKEGDVPVGKATSTPIQGGASPSSNTIKKFKDKLYQPGEHVPTPFDISKTKPGSKERASVIKSANEAGVNKRAHVIIEGKGIDTTKVPQHQEILRERKNYKSKKLNEKKSKPEYKARKEAEHNAALDSAKDQTVTLKPFSPKENEASRVSKMSSRAKTKYHKRMKKIDSQLPF